MAVRSDAFHHTVAQSAVGMDPHAIAEGVVRLLLVLPIISLNLQAVLGYGGQQLWQRALGGLPVKWLLRSVCTVVAAVLASKWGLEYLHSERSKARCGACCMLLHHCPQHS